MLSSVLGPYCAGMLCTILPVPRSSMLHFTLNNSYVPRSWENNTNSIGVSVAETDGVSIITRQEEKKMILWILFVVPFYALLLSWNVFPFRHVRHIHLILFFFWRIPFVTQKWNEMYSSFLQIVCFFFFFWCATIVSKNQKSRTISLEHASVFTS